MKFFFSFLIIAFCCISCVKHNGDIEEHIPVSTITFGAPTEGAIQSSKDSVRILATAVSSATIHGYDITIKKPNDTTVYWFKTVHDHNDTITIDQKWKGDFAAPTDLEASITLHLDHEGHTNTKAVRFQLR